MNCSQCSKKALYRNKQGKLYCYDHYWEQSEYSKPIGDFFSDSNVYRHCPYCGWGDTCDATHCVAKCSRCGIIDKNHENHSGSYCSLTCAELAEKERKQKEEQENSKRCSYCNKPSGNIGRNDYPGKHFCSDCINKQNPNFKKPSKQIIRQRKRNLKSGWVCPHYEAAEDNELIQDCRKANLKQALDHYLPEWKPIMKNQEQKNICADCYHDSAEYFLLVQKLTTEYIKKIMPKDYSLSSTSQNNYEKMKSGILANLDKWEQVKKQLVKEISDYKQGNISTDSKERTELQSEITNLEKKKDKTPAEQAELEEKKKRLAELERNIQNNSANKPTNYTPWILGGVGIVLVIGLIVYFTSKKNKSNQDY